MSLAEILEELPKLTEEERDELRSRLDEYDPGFLSILQERVKGIESGERETIPADQVIAEGRLGPTARSAIERRIRQRSQASEAS